MAASNRRIQGRSIGCSAGVRSSHGPRLVTTPNLPRFHPLIFNTRDTRGKDSDGDKGEEEDLEQAESTEIGEGNNGDDDVGTVNRHLSSHGIASTSASLITQTYYQATRRNAGVPTRVTESKYDEREETINRLLFSDRENEVYYPFKSQEDYAYSEWFTTSKISQTQINNFLRSPILNDPAQDRFSYANAEEWKRRVSQVPHGIQEDKWIRQGITIRKTIDDIQGVTSVIYYRDIIMILRFLLGHRAFEQNMTYAPVRLTNQRGERVYGEMHTGEWWWSKQGEIPENGTIIPLLLASDKTLMTRLHGDLSLWPVYVTIGNLDCAARKSQLRPTLILLGLIPVKTSEATGFAKNIQSEIYHDALGLMLERMNRNPETVKEILLTVCGKL